MKHERHAPRRFLTPFGGIVDLDELLADQQRRKVEMEDELTRTEATLTDAEQRLQANGPPTCRQLDVAQTLADTRNRYALLKGELEHLDRQLVDTRQRIAAFDRAGDGASRVRVLPSNQGRLDPRSPRLADGKRGERPRHYRCVDGAEGP